MFEFVYKVLIVLGVITLVVIATVVVAAFERMRRDGNEDRRPDRPPYDEEP